jgi:hypothetical protein
MRRIAIPRTVVVLLAAACGAAGVTLTFTVLLRPGRTRATRPPMISTDGRVGPLRLGVSTEADVLRFAGKPQRVERTETPGAGHTGHLLEYRCEKADCKDTYSIGLDGVMHDFQTLSTRFRTKHGSRVGMPTSEVERLEGRRFRLGCSGPTLRLGNGLELVAWKQRVAYILFLGRHTLYYDGDC